ncbi:chemotaxis protein CheD [Shewanella seohaensis]|uniref:Chemotaxis protein CheD n=1 Tax=Shewanella seohaensis TaxID=755175 RepID=A0ABV4VZ77_9GAMM
MLNSALSGVTRTLGPGDYVFNEPLSEIRTVLGSCVCVFFYHAPSGFYGAAHFICAYGSAGWRPGMLINGRYGNQILPFLLQAAKKRGIAPETLTVQIVGGAMSPEVANLSDTFQVGRVNWQYALSYVQRHGLCIAAVDVGGTCWRKLAIDPRYGQLLSISLGRGQ